MCAFLALIDHLLILSPVTEWETAPAVAESPEIKLFGKWSTDDVQINDISLQVSSKRQWLLVSIYFIDNCLYLMH